MRFQAAMPLLLAALFAFPTLAQESTRADFQEYAQIQLGRWLGEVTFNADWAGFGKKGDKVTGYWESTLAEDGNVLTGKFFAGKGSATGMTYFDAGTMQIKSIWVSDSVTHRIIYKKDGNWVFKDTGSGPDGTPHEGLNTMTLADGGKKITWAGSGTMGGKKTDDLHDIWRRVSK